MGALKLLHTACASQFLTVFASSGSVFQTEPRVGTPPLPCSRACVYFANYKSIRRARIPTPRGICPRLRGPDASGPVVFALQNNSDLGKGACQTRLAKRLQQGLQAESCASSDSLPKGATAVKPEPSIRLIQVLKSLIVPTIMSGVAVALTPPRMPSPLSVDFQHQSLLGPMHTDGT